MTVMTVLQGVASNSLDCCGIEIGEDARRRDRVSLLPPTMMVARRLLIRNASLGGGTSSAALFPLILKTSWDGPRSEQFRLSSSPSRERSLIEIVYTIGQMSINQGQRTGTKE